MAVTNTWLIDKSAYVRLAVSPDADPWITRIEGGLVLMSTVTRLEIGYSLRTGREARDQSASPRLLREAMALRGRMNLASYDRLFPSQKCFRPAASAI